MLQLQCLSSWSLWWWARRRSGRWRARGRHESPLLARRGALRPAEAPARWPSPPLRSVPSLQARSLPELHCVPEESSSTAQLVPPSIPAAQRATYCRSCRHQISPMSQVRQHSQKSLGPEDYEPAEGHRQQRRHSQHSLSCKRQDSPLPTKRLGLAWKPGPPPRGSGLGPPRHCGRMYRLPPLLPGWGPRGGGGPQLGCGPGGRKPTGIRSAPPIPASSPFSA